MSEAPRNAVVREAVGGMYPQGCTYHWRDGWYFCRGECLVVHVWNYEKKIELEIPANEWDSIVETLKE